MSKPAHERKGRRKGLTIFDKLSSVFAANEEQLLPETARNHVLLYLRTLENEVNDTLLKSVMVTDLERNPSKLSIST